MGDKHASHHDAELALRVYELRREPVMRESRNAIMTQFWPRTYESFISVSEPGNPLNAAFRQVSSYWEMVYGFCKHGAVNVDMFIESNGEGLFLFAKIRPFLEQFRREQSPLAFQNAEWVATQCEAGRTRYKIIEKRVAQLAERFTS